MHGNESTTTKALFDFINLLNNGSDLAKELLESLVDALRAVKKEAQKSFCRQESDDKKIMLALKKDYIGFFEWALGLEEDKGLAYDEMAPKWKELHPDLEIPRVITFKEGPQSSMVLQLFIMDAYPLYLKYKEWDAAGYPLK